jgi:hypothetical protein
MGHRVPLARHATPLDIVRHRQAMVNMGRVLNSRGDVAGFRPQYMEYVLVSLGHADPSLAAKTVSERSKRKRAAKQSWIAKFKRNQTQWVLSP